MSEKTQVDEALAALAPTADEQPNTFKAFERLQRAKRRNHLMNNTRKWAVAAAVLIAVVGLFALQPVRAAASSVLSIFRVQSFSLVAVDEERMREIADLIDEGTLLGEYEYVGGETEPTEVESMEAAAELAGFTPATLDGTPTTIMVQDDMMMQLTPDVAAIRDIFAGIGLDPEIMPASVDGQSFEFTLYPVVMTEYDNYGLIQSPAPEADIPAGVNMQELGAAIFQLWGMNPREANRMAREIDWATTLIVPVPAEQIRQIREVNVNGSTGLYMENDSSEGGSTLFWQADGFVYGLHTTGWTSLGDMLSTANSLK